MKAGKRQRLGEQILCPICKVKSYWRLQALHRRTCGINIRTKPKPQPVIDIVTQAHNLLFTDYSALPESRRASHAQGLKQVQLPTVPFNGAETSELTPAQAWQQVVAKQFQDWATKRNCLDLYELVFSDSKTNLSV